MDKFKSRLILLPAILIAGQLLLGCGSDTAKINNNSAENVNTTIVPVAVNANAVNAETVNANTAANVPDAPTAEKQMMAQPVTLPVLDAMFADETFAADIKNKVQLTDEQIAKLKEISHQSVAKLGETSENAKASTIAAVKESEEKIRGLIGDDKTNQLFALVRNKWSEGNTDTTAAQKPNAIPTDTRVVVNAPAYRMDIFKDGKLFKTYKIGIGYPEFPLASGLRKAETIIFNPTWTPPDEPWVKGKIKAGQKIEAGSSMNPLGPIKIPIGSPSLIHGGKSPAKIGMFNSHGCVGLTNAEVQDFALNLAQVSGIPMSPEDVQNYRKEKDKTKNVKLGQTMPVELRYETIVVENGVLHIYRDVYERKTNSLAALKQVLSNYGVDYDKLKQPDQKKILDALNAMNKDGSGQPIIKDVESDTAPTDANKIQKPDKNQTGSVTRSIKGGKEVAVPLAELSGKGYPAPVNLYSGK